MSRAHHRQQQHPPPRRDPNCLLTPADVSVMTGLSERQVRVMRGERDNCHLASDVLGVSHGEGQAVPMAMIGQGLDGTVAAAKGPNDEYRVLRTAIVSATPFSSTRSLHSVSAPNAAEQFQRRHKPQFDFTATIASDGTFTSLQGWRPEPDMVFTGTIDGRKYTFTVKEVFEEEDTPEDAPIPFTVKRTVPPWRENATHQLHLHQGRRGKDAACRHRSHREPTHRPARRRHPAGTARATERHPRA
jgi:hypothetical protein